MSGNLLLGVASNEAWCCYGGAAPAPGWCVAKWAVPAGAGKIAAKTSPNSQRDGWSGQIVGQKDGGVIAGVKTESTKAISHAQNARD